MTNNGVTISSPAELTDLHTILFGDMFTALVVLLATVDKRVRWLADHLVADPDTDPTRVLWFTANYGARTFPARIISTEAARLTILGQLDELHLSATQFTHWRTP
ncbi:Uncharacterised protein [Mycolicibacterium flavescens]|uniref:hypothetical protein n=1 Tax=Mycobacterium neumannii TaxID=2048551 RepID=UPI000B93DFC6|nr:hypothetical protein [Mycobacterium neumannii]VEG39411.1 Uncharacterised protein [Mycolicibacterium flavescens]